MSLLTAQELAEMLKISVATVWKKTRNGEFPSIKIGKEYRYDLEKIKQKLGI